MKRERKKEETALFYIGWFFVIILFIIYILLKKIPSLFQANGPCLIHMLFGIYCPGCGGTRAISAFFHGHLWNSFVCHPIVPYTFLLGGWFLISQTVERVSKHKLKIGLHYRDMYLWIALAIVVLNFIVKNVLLLVWQIDLLGNYTL